MKCPWFLFALISFSGCVSMSKYKTLQTQESQTSQSLQNTQASNATLKQANDKLSTDLAAARKQLASLVSDMKSDLTQAQTGIASALKRLDETSGASNSGSSAPNPPAPTPASAPAPTPAPAQ